MEVTQMGERLTKGDIEKIQAEIDERKLVLRPKLLEEVKETRAQGDLSENFEYHEAKRAKNMNTAAEAARSGTIGATSPGLFPSTASAR